MILLLRREASLDLLPLATLILYLVEILGVMFMRNGTKARSSPGGRIPGRESVLVQTPADICVSVIPTLGHSPSPVR